MPKTTLFTYKATVTDKIRGDVLWSDNVEVESYTEAKLEAKNAYRQYVCDGYEPGSYKAEAVLAAPVMIKVCLCH